MVAAERMYGGQAGRTEKVANQPYPGAANIHMVHTHPDFGGIKRNEFHGGKGKKQNFEGISNSKTHPQR